MFLSFSLLHVQFHSEIKQTVSLMYTHVEGIGVISKSQTGTEMSAG